MDGSDRNAGAVTGVTATRNPISLARAVMERSPARLPEPRGRRRILPRAGSRRRRRPTISRPPSAAASSTRCARRPSDDFFDIDVKYGTVGAVALDRHGHVAAATSTGGLTGKRWGRIGDSPIIGAGTYADDRGRRRLRDRRGRIFHPRRRRPRNLRADPLPARARRQRPRCRAAEAQAIADAVMAEVGELGGSGGVILVTPWGDGALQLQHAGHVSRRGLARRPLGRDLRRRAIRPRHDLAAAGMKLLRLLACCSRFWPALAGAGLVGIWP